MKLNIVNTSEYEKNEDYREIVIKIPAETEKLERDFRYLGLNYNNLSIQDTYVLECEVIDSADPEFSLTMSTIISNIIARANKDGSITTFQDMNSMFNIIKSIGEEDREKLLTVFEIKQEQICNMKVAIKYANSLEFFEYYDDISTCEEYAQKLIDDQEVNLEDVVDYINMEELGKAYINGRNGFFSDYKGLLIEKCPVEKYMKEPIYRREEEEEEFE